MKLFISADIEGVSGVTHGAEQTSQNGKQYADARKWMTGDVNAAIEGACAAGVTDVLVKDAHGWALNILPHELDERATLIQGWGHESGMMEGFTDEFGLVFLVGYHPRAGTPDGILAHTWSGSIRNVCFDGTDIGEIGISAFFAGAFGVPVGLVATCEAGKKEVADILPWAEGVAVKRGITQSAAELLPNKRAQSLIREAATRAVERRAEMQALTCEGPVTVRVTWAQTGQAGAAATQPDVELVDAYTVEFTAADQLAALKRLRTVFRTSH